MSNLPSNLPPKASDEVKALGGYFCVCCFLCRKTCVYVVASSSGITTSIWRSFDSPFVFARREGGG